jgi:hypothetical protein
VEGVKVGEGGKRRRVEVGERWSESGERVGRGGVEVEEKMRHKKGSRRERTSTEQGQRDRIISRK